jgi:precorrin-2 dehydrogenase/sirohydrochlorin ferrochelatase
VNYYPVFLNLKGKRCVVIGGGKVAERKVKGLLEAEASVTVISPQLTEELQRLKDLKLFTHVARSYQLGDLRDAFLVIAATSDMNVNKQIFREASEKPLNVVDIPELCTFIVPSIIRKGPLTVAISTSGLSPSLSRSLRLELQEIIPDEISEFLEYLYNIRKEIKGKEGTGDILREIGSQRILKVLITSGLDEAKKEVRNILRQKGLNLYT